MSTRVGLIMASQDVLSMALSGDMPSSFWKTDDRIARACRILGIDPDFAEQHAEENQDLWLS